jgi:8-oxo-dGTP pyrophosphatase MutT (NUDIX family)
MDQPIQRDAARIIVVGPDDRVLLFRYHLPHPWAREGWITPGGGVAPGETPAQAAARELREETGLARASAELGRAVAVNSGRWQAADTVFATVNWYFFVCVASLRVDLSGQHAYERRGLLDHRWWPITDLHTTADLVLPHGLAGLLSRLLDGDLPPEPIHLPWI